MFLDFSGFTIEFTRKPIKNINLRIYPAGKVTLSAPHKCPMDTIERYLEDKRDWIIARRASMLASPLKPEFKIQTDKHGLYLGESYPFVVFEGDYPKRVRLIDDSFVFLLPKGTSVEDKNRVLQGWYRKQFYELIPKLAKKWEPVVGANALSYQIKSMKTRWGTCNPNKKRIWLNLHLIQKPLICIEYVLVHELVHLHEPSHNRRFHALMHQFMPDWMTYKKLLRE